jgi:hypothetical protein
MPTVIVLGTLDPASPRAADSLAAVTRLGHLSYIEDTERLQ